MCANYTPVKDPERLKRYFGVDNHPAFPVETWPGYVAPFIFQSQDQANHERLLAVGIFGLVPHWAKDLTVARHTYNARVETVAVKPSFRDAWRHGQRCIVPVESFFEPNWESGKAVRWRIQRKDGAPMGLAGLWGAWKTPDGHEIRSFTMLTINADGHDVMRHFHKPTDEKRMVVILDEGDYDRWLDAPREQMPDFLTRYPAEGLMAEPAPRPVRGMQAGELF